MDKNQLQIIESLNSNNYLGATIIDTGGNTGVSYMAFSNGMLLQWGSSYKPANQYYGEITFSKSFNNNDYVVIITPTYWHDMTLSFSISDKTASSFRAWTSTFNETVVYYMAIGSWK